MSQAVVATEVGEAMPLIDLPDQFGEHHQLSVANGLVVFSAERDSGEMINKLLPKLPADKQNSFEYIIDISAMPRWVERWFALPKMKKLPRLVLLDREGQQTGGFPRQDGYVTLICVTDRALTEVRYLKEKSRLQQLLQSTWCR